MRPFGFNVIGHISANVGLGVVARNAIRLILRKGYPVVTFDIDPGHGRAGHEPTYDQLAVHSIDDLPYGVTLIILSMTALPDVLIDRRVVLREDVINAGYFWWELPVLTEVWSKSLEQFDVLVAGSQFIGATFERHVAGAPAVHALHAVQDVDDIRSDRAQFGLPQNKTVFVCIVEPSSDPLRKNPYAAIDAFGRAFKTDDDAHLVIKVNNAQAAGSGNPSLAPLREAVQRFASRVTLIETQLPHRDVIGLFACCDVFVGLHRAEGLGLGLMEAMALGKAVVATGWSGNMSFMNHTNACLVSYRLIPVSGSLVAYSPAFLKQDVCWADPDIEEAAAWMKALARDAMLREMIGRKAAEDINRYRVEAERGGFIEELRAIWEYAAIRPARRRADPQLVLAMLREALFDHKATSMQKARRKSLGLLDRHLLWRFRSR
jgi:glycosyltransferase involved in cell wall biosynthesis